MWTATPKSNLLNNWYSKNKIKLWGFLLPGVCEGAHGRSHDIKPKSLSFSNLILTFFL